MVMIEIWYLFYFHPFYDPTQWKHRDRRITFNDEDPSIDYLSFLHWTNAASTENLQDMLEQLDSNILVH